MLFQESVIAFLHDILIVVSRCRDLILILGLSMTPGYFHWKQMGKRDYSHGLGQVPIQNEVHTSLTWHNKKY